MGLHRYHRVFDVGWFPIQMGHELVERFGADSAGMAVLEEKQGPIVGGGKQTVELVEPLKRSQLWMHSIQSSRRSKSAIAVQTSSVCDVAYSKRAR